jgi:ABC-type multidrug transport system fused ATPase/permease subunit
VAAYAVFLVVDRVSRIVSDSRCCCLFVCFVIHKNKFQNKISDGVRDVELRGDVEFDSVRFAFPSRPDQLVLKVSLLQATSYFVTNNTYFVTNKQTQGVSVSIAAGSVIGVVGSSGAGKSTLIALLERFHDPNTGTVKIDGRPIQVICLFVLFCFVCFVCFAFCVCYSVKSTFYFCRTTT